MAKTIFIIEDEIFLQGLEASRLKKEGYNVLTAGTGMEVDKIIDSKVSIDLVLLDLLLPDTSGYDILGKIRKDSNLSQVKVIIFSNLSEEKDIKKAEQLGISAFMIKSDFDLGQLATEVNKILG